MYSQRNRLETRNFGFKKKRDYTIRVVKTKALNSFAVTAKLVCAFVFAYAICWFSHAKAHFMRALLECKCAVNQCFTLVIAILD